MRRVFVDTSAWLALADSDDAFHAIAVAALEGLISQRIPLVTSDYVLDETVTRIRYDLGHRAAVLFLDRVEQAHADGSVHVIRIDETLWRAAVGLFRQYSDQAFSLTDCTSFALARDQGIGEAFAFDRHFGVFGLTILPGP